ncbi:copper chaperone PCu(A)C [Parerythrobacter lacustris]|uniref:Copper chaperone PCu(A)C n=1 Tax=Parerythrobacter lacustris TaxID=2969984 RepID=A0ABT1XQD1_9SPHN|nr:copper chaperone PCu(A)C [Parerythrobacter lacustris]MCR2833858.1 copper chaperone PCu(A)C [Parerythrobacter lacustris]
MKSGFTRAAIAAALTFGLAACGDATNSEGETAEAAKPKERIVVENARLVLPAVAGNPAAGYFDLTYMSGGGPVIESITVEGAGSSEIHAVDMIDGMMKMDKAAPISLMARTPVKFEPGGYHVMAMKPADTLKAGGKTNMTIKLSNGEEATVPLDIKAAGDER